MSMPIQNQQHQQRKAKDKQDLELMNMAEYARAEDLRQQQEAITETEIDLGESKSLTSTIDQAYKRFVEQKQKQGETADWESKHNITDKPKLSGSAQAALLIGSLACTMVLFSIATMGLPLVAILIAAPIVVGIVIAAFKSGTASASGTEPWCKDQRELINSANITEVVTELNKSKLTCKTKDFIEINRLISHVKNSAKGIGNRYMSSEQLKDKLSDISSYVAKCEEFIARNQRLDGEMNYLKQGILALPADNKQRSEIYAKYNELEGKLEKGANSLSYQEASDMRRELSNQLSQIQAALPRKVTAVPGTSNPVNSSTHRDMTTAAASGASQGVSMSRSPQPTPTNPNAS